MRLETQDYTHDMQWRIEDDIAAKGMPTDELEFRISYSQGDGVAWYGNIDLKKLHEAEPGLFTLTPSIVKVLKGEWIGDAEIIISRNSFGHHYAHYNTMSFEGYVNGPDSDEEDVTLVDEMDRLMPGVEEFTRSLSKKMEKQAYDIAEGFTSDEAVKDYAINCMEDDFTKDGGIY